MSYNNIIHLPELVDSEVSSGIITLNEDRENLKERQTLINLVLENDNEKENLNFYCDYSCLVNISYKMKSALNSIDLSINNLAK
jgi:hypothetical protein